MKTTVLLLLASFFLSGCYSYHSKTDVNARALNEKLKGKVIDFPIVLENVFQKNCIQCHSQYENYVSVRRELENILNSVEFDRMPKNSGPLNGAEKQLLIQWAQAGAPETASEPPAPIENIPLQPRWDSIAANILVPKCQVCHSTNGEAKFLDLTTRQLIFNNRSELYFGVPFLNFDNPEESYLIQVVNDEEEPMPPIDSSINQLSIAEKAVLIEWIALGLP